jgi:Ni/Co efflux regulator RcnB
MTTRSTLTKFTLLTATLAASMVLLSATGGAQARDYDRHDHSGYGDRDDDRDHDRDRDRDRDHDRDDHDHPPYHDNPIVVHPVHGPGSSHNPIVVVVRDHRGSGFPGNVRDHRGPDGAPGGVTVSGFQGDVRDHRGP